MHCIHLWVVYCILSIHTKPSFETLQFDTQKKKKVLVFSERREASFGLVSHSVDFSKETLF